MGLSTPTQLSFRNILSEDFPDEHTLEGFWSLLRSWLRPHRGISQERLPLYLGFFAFVHNVRRRGKALLGSLIELLVAPRNPG
jgi:transposase-like protein